MKKIILIFTILLAVYCNNVEAATCGAKLVNHSTGSSGVMVTIPLNDSESTTGYINMATIVSKADSSRKGVAFCLAVGKNAHNGATYVLDKSNSIDVEKNNIRKAFAFANNITNYDTVDSQIRYTIAQTVIWQELTGGYQEDTLRSTAWEAYRKFACAKQGYTDNMQCSEYISKHTGTFEELLKEFKSTPIYSGYLYVYQHATDPEGNQPFLTNVLINETDCTTGGGGGSGTSAPTCKLGAMRIDADPAACNNNDGVNSGYFGETYDSTLCGDGTATVNGTFNRRVGEYCSLYCTEEAYQYYPGGISSPIALGTNLVWPTSTATQATIWGNLYSLSYTGKKTCKLVMKDEQSIMSKYSNFASIVKSYERSHSGVSEGACDSIVRTALQEASGANQRLGIAQVNANNAKSALDAANASLSSAQHDRDNAEQTYNAATNAYKTCYNKCIKKGNSEDACKHRTKNGGCYNYLNTMNAALNSLNQKNNAVASAQSVKNQKESAYQNAVNELNSKQSEYDAKQATYESENSACNTYKDAYNNATKTIANLNTCLNYKISPEDLYKFQSTTSIQYNDPEYGTSYSLVGSTSYSCEGCEPEQVNLTIDSIPLENAYSYVKNIISNRQIVVTANASYTLPTDGSIYKYIDKRTSNPIKNPTSDYINVGYSFLPTSYNASVTTKYDLKVVVDCLGENCKFIENGVIKTNDTTNNELYDYTCHYSHVATSDECICPTGTKHAGEDLFPKIANASSTGNPITCATAQYQYCDTGNNRENPYCVNSAGQTVDLTACLSTNTIAECIEQNCPGGTSAEDKFCIRPSGESVKMTSCLNNGRSKDDCMSLLGCTSGSEVCANPADCRCPRETDNGGMDLRPCVYAAMAQGLTLDEALQSCETAECPYSKGVRIIYRTISLRNPFPGKTAGVGKIQTTVDFNLDSLRGRRPGANWNSVSLVKNEILYNRSVEADDVYDKEPLYSFVLDTSTVKKIRSYNQSRTASGGYADFTLTCKNGVACLSSFIRDPQYGLVGGTCKDNSHNDFYSCSES